MTRTLETQVLIVGAGPVGRSLALDLVGRGIDVLVVEQNESGVVAGVCRQFAPVQPSLRSSPSPWHRAPIDSPGMVTKSEPSPGRGLVSATPRAARQNFVVGDCNGVGAAGLNALSWRTTDQRGIGSTL
jgi:glycine/D-amino acid oxidase-like deaminating enzyme